jgi:RNA polymerase sigma factor for flagellar operon FliA
VQPLTNEQARLVETHLHLVRITARRLSLPYYLSREDILSEGYVGLCRAAASYDPDKSAFQTHAITRIKGAIWEYLRREDHLPRSRRKEANALGLDDLPPQYRRPASIDGHLPERYEAEGGDNPSKLVERALIAPDDVAGDIQGQALRGLLLEALLTLSPRERELLACIHCRGLVLREIAPRLGVCESRVLQLRNQAYRRIRAYLQQNSN